MSKRTPHIQSSGTFFHIYNRGVDRNTIFFDESNYWFFIKRLKEYAISEIDVVAYCLMPNHFHLLVHQHKPKAVSAYIGRVCKSYVHAINKQRARTGHLFEGKYKIKAIDSVQYLLHLSRYIHLNPVRASLVDKGEEWKFSSYQSYIMQGASEDHIKTNVVLQEFNGRSDYKDFVESYQSSDKLFINSVLF